MSAYDEDYRELIEGVRDAAYELLRVSTPDSLMGLRREYTKLRRLLESDDQERQKEQEREQKDRHRRELAEIRERRNVWAQIPRERRETLLLQVLGGERLILRELTSRLNAELGTPDSYVYQGNVRSLVMRMFHAGQLDRAEETFKNKPRYRYFHKRTLDGPIVDLERAYHHDEGEDR